MRYKKWSWTAVIAITVLIVAVFGVLMWLTANARRDAQERHALLQADLVDATEERSSLVHVIDSLGTDSYIEDTARSEYGYVKRGEIRFEITNPDLLDNYTEEEWKIILDEMAWDGR